MGDDQSSSSLQKQAIDAALKCHWDKALEINLQLIEDEPNNVECLNRIAKAYLELGKYTQAEKSYQTVLAIDPYNTIAQKNLKKVATFKKNGVSKNGDLALHHMTISPSLFVAEPGITKTVTLIKVAEPNKLIILSPGQIVNLSIKSRGISVTDLDNGYLGALPDDIAHHLLKLIAGGNRYQAYIKSVKPNALTILIREEFRSKKYKNQASFLDDVKTLTLSSQHITFLTDDNESDADSTGESEEGNI